MADESESRGTLTRTSPRPLVPLTRNTPTRGPPTKGSLQWFQQKHKQWQNSPRDKISPLPKTPSSSTSQPLRQTSVQPLTAPSQKSPFSLFKPSSAATPPLPKSASSFSTQKSNLSAFNNENAALSSFKTSRSSPLAAVAPTPAEDPSAGHRDRLIQFYTKYNPAKLDTVDQTLASYKGKEDVLFQKLEQKYVSGKDGMLPPTGTGSRCFMDFSVDGRSIGRVVIQLFQDKAPLACENFRCLCTGEKGKGLSSKDLCFKYSKIHRLVPGMCIQGGDFTKGNGTGGESIFPPNSQHGDMWGKFKDETPFLMHTKKGLVSMANNGPNRNGSQFFFTLKALPYLDGKHVVFGDVLSGMEVLDDINKLESDPKQRPAKTVMIENCGQLKEDGTEVTGTEQREGLSQPSGSTAFGRPPQQQQFSAAPQSSASSNTTSGSAFNFGAPKAPSETKASFNFEPAKAPAETKTPFNFPAAAAAPKAGGIFSFGLGGSSFGAVSKDATTEKSPSFSFGGVGLDVSAEKKVTSSSTAAMQPSAFGQVKSGKEAGGIFGSTSAFSVESSGNKEALADKPGTSVEKSAAPKPGVTSATPSVPAFSFGKLAYKPGFSTEKAGATEPTSETVTSSTPAFSVVMCSEKPESALSKPSFSFGKMADKPDTSSEKKPEAPKPSLTSITASTPTFSFGKLADEPAASVEKSGAIKPTSTTPPSAPSTSAFSFGKLSSQADDKVEKSLEPKPTSATASSSTPAIAFSKLADEPKTSTVAPKLASTAAVPPTFSFGKPADEPKISVEKSVASKPASATETPAFSFGEKPLTPAKKVEAPKQSSTATTTAMPVFSFGKQPAALVEKSTTPKLESSNEPAFSSEELPDQLPKPAWTTTPSKSATLSGKVPKSDVSDKQSFSFGKAPQDQKPVTPKAAVAVASVAKAASSSGKPPRPDVSFEKFTTASTVTTSPKPALSFGQVSHQSDTKVEKSESKPSSAFSFGKLSSQPGASDKKPATPLPASNTTTPSKPPTTTPSKSAFSFGKPPQPNVKVEKAEVPKPGSAFTTPSKPSAGADDKPTQTSTSVGASVATPASTPGGSPWLRHLEQNQASQAVPTKPASRRGTPSPAKPMLPSFYFGEDKSSTNATAQESTPRTQGEPVLVDSGRISAKENANINLTRKLDAVAQDQNNAVDSMADKDVSFARFSPNFIKSEEAKAPEFKCFASSPKSSAPSPAVKATASSPNRGDSRAPVASTKNNSSFQTPPKAKKTMSTRPRSAQKIVLGGVAYSPGSNTKRPREVEEAVTDILAERVFCENDLMSKVSVEQVERLMATPLERKIEVLEQIDRIESRGTTLSWDDIELVLRKGRTDVAATNTPQLVEDFKSCDTAVTESIRQADPGPSAEMRFGAEMASCSSPVPDRGATLEVWVDADRARTSSDLAGEDFKSMAETESYGSAVLEVREDADRASTGSCESVGRGQRVSQLQKSTGVVKHTPAKDVASVSTDPDDMELLLLNLETLN